MKIVLNLLAIAAIATFTSCASKPAAAPSDCSSCSAKAPAKVNKKVKHNH
jgi:hypothetical protein